jgi:hypothetical protein
MASRTSNRDHQMTDLRIWENARVPPLSSPSNWAGRVKTCDHQNEAQNSPAKRSCAVELCGSQRPEQRTLKSVCPKAVRDVPPGRGANHSAEAVAPSSPAARRVRFTHRKVHPRSPIMRRTRIDREGDRAPGKGQSRPQIGLAYFSAIRRQPQSAPYTREWAGPTYKGSSRSR